ncbi:MULTISPECIES: beta-ribofuranosylaminobenzene 5'-phosphate synthase [unclassified Methanoregula]|uniref:beta-ribofuranosylaminobenzene 5'-phosphate synthase n=1 Tax=unclassified Methanoregula TaxID=2649730 RepID=UPI0009CAF3D9|nr:MULTISPECIES: beta-ribofuranosylaminobenzene 5'-phosphate synthase [unclassified Methanoregula]OPX64137.1 MAG: Beta-ribofuranosylaminobenzene 5'-phosphate synthase [Methanoregula sp. PtaB.Bin085]OPY34743.1 MAG: Beta-ribofuranosylaminobenzene 5'-phosphate synthase [Methanoregula sp. PtaU1.Bin006]
MDIARAIAEMEMQVGRISPVQKFLLGTDGSVTQILESITGKKVIIRTLVQNVIPADTEAAGILNVSVGDPVNYRVVEIRTEENNEVLIYAISHTPVNRLSPEFRDDLMKADIPIGRIISRHHIEARREILSARVTPASEEMGRIFGICKNEPLLSRQYQIIHAEKPLMFIEEQFPYNRFLDSRRVIVRTPSRIHVTLIDLHGGSGRVDGGIGITLDEPGVLLEAELAPALSVSGGDPAVQDRVRGIVMDVLRKLGAGGNVAITIRSFYPSHVGLGSGSQLALAVARAIAELHGRHLPVKELAKIVGRGGTSGIGTAAFEYGGFIVDGGHRFGAGGEKTDFRPSAASRGVSPPPVIARHDFPADWRILLAIPNVPAGASGGREVDIFRDNCPVPLDEVRQLSHEILMRMLPGIASRDLDLFGSSINAVQALGFKRVEIAHQPPQVTGLPDILRNAGAAGAGLSSFGPAVYAVGDTGMTAIEQAAQSFMNEHSGGTTLITTARNSGAVVRVA